MLLVFTRDGYSNAGWQRWGCIGRDDVSGARFCCYHSWCSGLLMAVSGSAVLRHSLCRGAWRSFVSAGPATTGFAIGGTGHQRHAIEKVFKLSGVGTAQISP
jgi:hypothetical protein